jgi:hypothetical protein
LAFVVWPRTSASKALIQQPDASPIAISQDLVLLVVMFNLGL